MNIYRLLKNVLIFLQPFFYLYALVFAVFLFESNIEKTGFGILQNATRTFLLFKFWKNGCN
jgi:hypothetical protein